MFINSFVLPLIFLLGASSLNAFILASITLGRIESTKRFNSHPYYYFFFTMMKRLYQEEGWAPFRFMLSATKQIARLLYAASAFLYFSSLFVPNTTLDFVYAFILVVAVGLLFDWIIRFFTLFKPRLIIKLATPLSTLFLLIFFPLTFLLFITQRKLFQIRKSKKGLSSKLRDKILEVITETEFSRYLTPVDRRLILSATSFRDRIAREVMVPRVNLFSLSVNHTVHEAAMKFKTEGYSRIPIYQDSVDNIIGILLYKDVLNYYVDSVEKKDESLLKTPLEKLITPILYAPETKRISHLLQEFRNKQIHIAIVVDEYGGTEGIITIEDILEELVGEIADEHDILHEEVLFSPLPGGGWVVDAMMSIIDIEKELGITIPHNPEYDTIGGYVFHRAGTIPSKGWRLHHDQFDLEVLLSNERSIQKIRVIPSGNHD